MAPLAYVRSTLYIGHKPNFPSSQPGSPGSPSLDLVVKFFPHFVDRQQSLNYLSDIILLSNEDAVKPKSSTFSPSQGSFHLPTTSALLATLPFLHNLGF